VKLVKKQKTFVGDFFLVLALQLVDNYHIIVLPMMAVVLNELLSSVAVCYPQ